MELIRTESVVKRQGSQFSLGPVDLALRAGEVLGIIGNPAAGKTTLLKLIWGFLRPDQGIVSVFRTQPHLNQMFVRRRTGYLSESPSFNVCITARRHLEFVSQFYDGWNEERANSLLKLFDINPGVCVQDLSHSAKIKLALISAAGHNPFLLLLDEPMARLDDSARNEISQFLKSLASDYGIGIVVSAQNPCDLLRLADSTLTLIGGKTQQHQRRK
jgi:ABC-2 type transport system ATP-binding protein